MELWNDGTTAFNAVESDAAGVYLPEGRHPIIPFFQHSIIPIAKLSSTIGKKSQDKKIFFQAFFLPGFFLCFQLSKIADLVPGW
jgi:hypothetical protein